MGGLSDVEIDVVLVSRIFWVGTIIGVLVLVGSGVGVTGIGSLIGVGKAVAISS